MLTKKTESGIAHTGAERNRGRNRPSDCCPRKVTALQRPGLQSGHRGEQLGEQQAYWEAGGEATLLAAGTTASRASQHTVLGPALSNGMYLFGSSWRNWRLPS